MDQLQWVAMVAIHTVLDEEYFFFQGSDWQQEEAQFSLGSGREVDRET